MSGATTAQVSMSDLLQVVVDEGASDLHITVGLPPTLRLHGSLQAIDCPPLRPEDTVQTLEGLAEDPLMTRIQQSYVEEGAVQCGFCIPAMVVSSYHLLKHTPDPTSDQIKEALSGNICRCTGYSKIEQAVARAARKKKEK